MNLLKSILLAITAIIFFPNMVEAKEKKYKNGDFYSGDWKKGKPNGKGVKRYANGDIYTGNWENGEPNGEGVISFAPNYNWIYSGKWNNGQIDKDSIFICSMNEDIFKGYGILKNERITSLKDFEPKIGALTLSTFSFTGNFENGLPHEGELMFSNGNQINGTFNVDSSWPNISYQQIKVIDGEGKAMLVDNNFSRHPAIYDGEWENGNFTGKITGTELTSEITSFIINVDTDGNQTGEFVYKNGDTYKGDIKNNKKDGSGVLTKKVGDNYQGIYITAEWLNDKLMSGGLWENIVDPDTGKTKTYLFDVKNDKVYYTLKDGSIYELKTPVDGRQFYSEVQQYEQEQIKLAQEAARKEARKKDAKAIDQKYAGMVFEGEGSLLMLSDNGEAALIGFLIGARTDQILSVSFLPGGKVNVRERDINVRKSDPSRVTTTQLLAMAVNSGGGTTYEATLDGNKIILSDNLYIVVSPDKKSLSIYGSDGGYKLKRK